MEDNIGIDDKFSIRLIPESDWNRDRCGTCFAFIGNQCAKSGINVDEYSQICEYYDPENG
jgi:hypothetical protein